jgi:PDZ domain-containing protein
MSDAPVFTPPPPPPAPPVDATEPTPPRPRMRWWSWVAIALATIVFVGGIAGFVIHVPYTTISPGDAVSLDSLVHVDGAKTYPDIGDIRLLYVRERNHVSFWRYVQAKLDKNTELLKEKEVNPDNEPQPDLEAEDEAAMSEAKIAATKVALEAAGYTVKPAPGYVINAVLPSKPASKVLKAGDLIVSADGKKVVQGADLTAAVRSHRPGQTMTLGIERDGKPMTVKVGIGQDKNGSPEIGVLVFPNYNFPVHVSVDTAGIQGPSGGLAMTLAILDDLTPGNLTGGQRVAVTGTIDIDGNVGEIGGIEQKAIAARARHAKLFIVPQCLPEEGDVAGCQKDLAAAQKKAGSGMKVIPVATFAEALAALRANGGAPVVKVGPTLTAAA